MLVPNIEQMVWLHTMYKAGEFSGWPLQLLPASQAYDTEEERERTLDWLAENGWVEHTPGDDFDLLELTDLATENMETIAGIVETLRS